MVVAAPPPSQPPPLPPKCNNSRNNSTCCWCLVCLVVWLAVSHPQPPPQPTTTGRATPMQAGIRTKDANKGNNKNTCHHHRRLQDTQHEHQSIMVTLMAPTTTNIENKSRCRWWWPVCDEHQMHPTATTATLVLVYLGHIIAMVPACIVGVALTVVVVCGGGGGHDTANHTTKHPRHQQHF